MNIQNEQNPPKEKKKLKITAAAFLVEQKTDQQSTNSDHATKNKKEKTSLDKNSKEIIPDTLAKVQSLMETKKLPDKPSKKQRGNSKPFQEDQFPPLNSVDVNLKLENGSNYEVKINAATIQNKQSRAKKVRNEWKELNILRRNGFVLVPARKKKDTKIQNNENDLKNTVSSPEKFEKENKKVNQVWPTPKINRIRDIIISLYKEKNVQDPRKDLHNMAALLKDLKKKGKKPSKLKKAKLLYLLQNQVAKSEEIDDAKQNYFLESKIKKKNNKGIDYEDAVGNKDDGEDGFITYDDEEGEHDEKLSNKAENEEELKKKFERKEEYKFEPIDVIKLPQIQYNQIKLRSWVDHILCPQIDEHVMIILNRLASIQIKKKIQQPKKFKRRIMCGMREVIRSVETEIPARLSKCIILALNIQEIPVKDGPDEKIMLIIAKAKEKNIPIIHSCTRRILGYACTGNQSARMSVISIVDYSGIEEDFKNLLLLMEEKKLEFLNKVSI